jgi:Zn-dependent protease/CBS domain-containing protein
MSLKIGKALGIPIYLHFTFLIILPLFIYVFSTETADILGITLGFGGTDLSTAAKIAFGTVAALMFFAAVLAHELAHSYVAIRYGVRIKHITLMLFGGVASMEEMPRKPLEELKMAFAGPMASFVIGVVSFGGMFFVDLLDLGSSWESIVILLGLTGFYNVLLAGFNLMPAFPMDGGRVLRSYLATKMSYVEATKKAAYVAKVLAIGMAVVSLVVFFNLFLLLIAMFIYFAAREEERATIIGESLDGLTVRQLMSDAIQVVHPSMSVQQLLDMMMATNRTGFPVVDYGLVGIVTLSDTRKVPKDRAPVTQIRDIMTRDVVTVRPDTTANDGVRILSQKEIGRLVVVDDRGNLVGIVTKKDFTRMVDIMEARKRGTAWGQPGWEQQIARPPPPPPPVYP